MNFEQFMEVIKKQVSDMIWLDKVNASISEFKKNNGVVLHGLCIRKKGEQLCPVIIRLACFRVKSSI